MLWGLGGIAAHQFKSYDRMVWDCEVGQEICAVVFRDEQEGSRVYVEACELVEALIMLGPFLCMGIQLASP